MLLNEVAAVSATVVQYVDHLAHPIVFSLEVVVTAKGFGKSRQEHTVRSYLLDRRPCRFQYRDRGARRLLRHKA
jgi:hypothetical protein